MGRGSKLRRGYSLEVIFEEDPDFCSNLDSLDSLAIRFGVKKEKEDALSVDSLVEEYHLRFGQTDKEQVYRSLDGIWDVRDMDTCFIEWDEFSLDSQPFASKMSPGGASIKCEFEPHKVQDKVDIASNGRRSRVSRRQILEAHWIFDENENFVENEKEVEIEEKSAEILDTDNNLDSYLSTKTDDTETNAYNYADSDHFNDSSLNASTPYSSTSSAGSVCTINEPKQPKLEDLGTINTDVKKVRALFESPAQRLYSKKSVSPTPSNGVGGVQHKLNQQHTAVGKLLRSAYSQFNLDDRNSDMDFAELLVNDRVVIEDSNNNNNSGYHTVRRKRAKENFDKENGFSSLRRSRSMEISAFSDESPSSRLHSSQNSSKPCILVEELPAPDTVKNVRTVFEQILKMRNESESTSLGGSALSIVKKSLRSIKSNPSSKIYRSESLRDDFPSSLKKFGKPICLDPRSQSPGSASGEHAPLSRQASEPVKFSPKINSPVRPFVENKDFNEPINEEQQSSLFEDDNPPKFVSPEVLQRIRALGSSTTYFGGQVISKIEGSGGRKLPVSRRHTLMDFKEFVPDLNNCFSNSSCSSRTATPTVTPTPTPTKERKYIPRRLSPELGDVFSLGANSIDTTPRIISVVPKSPSNSPSKTPSPAGSIIEGRGTPEGQEASIRGCVWINEIPVELDDKRIRARNNDLKLGNDGNNNNLLLISDKLEKVRDVSGEGAWF